MKGEFIICAAIHVDDKIARITQPDNIKTGFVISGRRHSDCYLTIAALVGDIQEFFESLGVSFEDERKRQGFITSSNRFVDRKEAYKIAKANNQIQHGLKSTENGDDSILISENLY